MSNEFDKFKKVFKEYQALFGLSGYKVYFKQEPLQDDFASCKINLMGRVVTILLDTNASKEDRKLCGVEENAKHEALHLLLGRLSILAHSRYVSQNEIEDAEEEIIRRLEKLIK